MTEADFMRNLPECMEMIYSELISVHTNERTVSKRDGLFNCSLKERLKCDMITQIKLLVGVVYR